MTLHRLSSENSEGHMANFLEMISDYEANDPVALANFFPKSKEWNEKSFKTFLKACDKDAMEWRPKAKSVSQTRYLYLDKDGKILGNGIMRFPLTDETESEGGNLEYNIPPSMRKSDAAIFTLNAMLFEAVKAGLARALTTCFADDLGAINAALKNRGELIDSVKSQIHAGRKINRYWINFR
jgi:predicted acetyltransferase